MAQPYENQTDVEFDEQSFPDIYLPAMAPLSTARGRFESFVTDLFRRRGELPKVELRR